MLNYVSEINEIAPPDPGGFPSLFSRRDLFLSSFSKINSSFSAQFDLSDVCILCQKNQVWIYIVKKRQNMRTETQKIRRNFEADFNCQ